MVNLGHCRGQTRQAAGWLASFLIHRSLFRPDERNLWRWRVSRPQTLTFNLESHFHMKIDIFEGREKSSDIEVVCVYIRSFSRKATLSPDLTRLSAFRLMLFLANSVERVTRRVFDMPRILEQELETVPIHVLSAMFLLLSLTSRHLSTSNPFAAYKILK